ncbi:redox-regulated ATPase YchF [Vulcanisaeta souniana]|uniref:Translation-associated GTPase n=1 Tax=Vulcanisaeta souniana JCM 11219 TaxID=1293586 RepID=A0A830E4V6_9CREN|nr:redox-regulated ATPase YchF [Vulcanisaeta souniana]BDR91749.1 translation-associated GTPase [Vulcanisaeta souniana JCM 11219]GGI70697.1 translation-associated GTPase [Vulcanisaeta souniana JCM 11219]
MPLQSHVQVGIVGKPNVGKSTFFAAATMIDVKIAPYPFTTIEPNVGIGYVRIPCVCRDLGVKDNPRNSICIEGNRFIPVELIDVAGLVPGAWQGRGLGNQFLDHLRRAPVLIHVIDMAGATDEEGRLVKPGSHDPLVDIEFLSNEVTMWMVQMLSKDWDKLVRLVDYAKRPLLDILYERFSGLGITQAQISDALVKLDLDKKPLSRWSDDDIKGFVSMLRELSKPMVIAANKMDIPEAEDNYRRIVKEVGNKYRIIPVSADYELALRKAAKANLIKYVPGDDDFEIISSTLSKTQRDALERIRDFMHRWGGTGIIKALNTAVFDVLGMIAIYPVADERKFTDTEGNVLPDVLLLPRDATVLDLAREVHSEIAEKAVTGIDAITGKRLGVNSRLWHRAVIRIYITK